MLLQFMCKRRFEVSLVRLYRFYNYADRLLGEKTYQFHKEAATRDVL